MKQTRARFTAMLAVAGIAILLSAAAQGQKNPYVVESFLEDGRQIERITVPGRPPAIKAPAVQVPKTNLPGGYVGLNNVPAFTWCYGCSATSAAMMMGYYDNATYTNMYTGPANGGVCPLNNETVWGHTSYPEAGDVGECPLSATHQGVDGRTTRGHVDDYWIDYDNAGPDPWIVNKWTQHVQGECTADYMGTNQSKFDNTDGATTFYIDTTGGRLYDYARSEPRTRDGCHGMKLFAEARGYAVTANYTQLIYPNSVYSEITQGFTLADYKAEIDAGRPVMIQVLGHSMVGLGYDAGSTIYIHDTWDNLTHTMTWGNSYSGMTHYAVTVLQLGAAVDPLHLLFPSDTGITLEQGKACSILWETLSPVLTTKSRVKITLLKGDGGPWVIAPSVPNKGVYKWTVGKGSSKAPAGYPDGDDYTVRVGTVDDQVFDDSDSEFAIGTITSLTFDGSPTSVVGGTIPPPQFYCTGHFDTGADLDVTALVKWSCSKVKGVKMGKTGLLTTAEVSATTPCTITASYGKGKSPVLPAEPLQIDITPK